MQSPEKYSLVSNAIPIPDLFKKTDHLNIQPHLHRRVVITLESQAVLRPGARDLGGKRYAECKGQRYLPRFQVLELSDEKSQTTQFLKAVTGDVFQEQTPPPGIERLPLTYKVKVKNS